MLVHPRLATTAIEAAKNAGLDKTRVFLFSDTISRDTHRLRDIRTTFSPTKESKRWQWPPYNAKASKEAVAVINFSSG